MRRIRERLVVKLARFDGRHVKLMNVASVLGGLSVGLGWMEVWTFQNNVLGSLLFLIGFLGVFGRFSVWLVARTRSPVPFVVPLTYLPRHPDSARPRKFRYARPRQKSSSIDSNRSALDPYVRISARNIPVAGAHPDLDPEKRFDLYNRWFRICPHSFLALERRNWLRQWETIAISIVLPLTSAGREKFCLGDVEVVRLDENHIAAPGHSVQHLLLDTLIVEGFQARTSGYGFPGLLIRHLEEFWHGDTGVLFYVEPDSSKIESNLLAPLRFKKSPDREGNKSSLYEFHYPDDVIGDILKEKYDKLRKNIKVCGSWTIHEA